MEACGVEIKETYSPSELVEIAEKFRDQDPGGLGSQLVPISIHTYDMLKLYPITDFTPADGYYKDENGQFQWAPADERTLESLKKYQNLYTSGLLDPEIWGWILTKSCISPSWSVRTGNITTART